MNNNNDNVNNPNPQTATYSDDVIGYNQNLNAGICGG